MKIPEDVKVGVGIYGLSLRLECGEQYAFVIPVTAWFRQQPKERYTAGFQGLVKRWDKRLNVQGDYVEK
jgi:hypothetical protein